MIPAEEDSTIYMTIPPSALENHDVTGELNAAIKENANLKKEIRKLNKLKID